ncbi:cytosolic regulator pianissimo [Coniella lustricola]|uniref:Cytosolic regulator pianissimo n=1 Tax=Coniella lustricola TaxID=2025994 RepID=A0A2T2ZZ19_9PEZI|nr:cytosolic regulator pianissimo [Coniella lustricola]
MDGPLSSSAGPTLGVAQRDKEKAFNNLQASSGATTPVSRQRPSLDHGDGSNLSLQPPGTANGAPSVRTVSSPAASYAPRSASFNPSSVAGPGSFSTDLRSQIGGPPRTGSRPDLFSNLGPLNESTDGLDPEKLLADLRDELARENKIKEGSENMLEALNTKKPKHVREQKAKVEAELNASYARIRKLKARIEDVQQAKTVPITPTRPPGEPSTMFRRTQSRRSASRSGAGSDLDEMVDPTYRLGELLQALEVEGLTPEYYVGKANALVALFKSYPNIKYDLVWSIFGLRMQVMLLSESREVVAAGYRMTRYAMSDRSSLKKIRTLNTDYVVISSLIKDRKADLEREQALKFVRAFLDIKDGIREMSRVVVRTIASIAEHSDDRLRPICLETLAEILVRDPQLLLASGGLSVICDALTEGSYRAPESLISAYLLLLDSPQKRKYLRPGYDLEVIFNVFTDAFLSNETILKHNSKAISSALRTWPGIMYLSMYNFRAIRSLIASLMLPNQQARDIIIVLLYSLLRIKSPAWATPFLAGRRLTTYGRVNILKPTATEGTKHIPVQSEDDSSEQNFVDHYTALLLAVLVKADLVSTLLNLARNAEEETMKRKSTLLLGEVLRLCSRLLPTSWSSNLQFLPDLFSEAVQFDNQSHFVATSLIYQISSVSRTLYRSTPSVLGDTSLLPTQITAGLALEEEQPRAAMAMPHVDEGAFRQLLVDSGVLSSSNYLKWNWEIVLKLIEGPLTIGKRVDDANKASKFMKRLMGFYRPFKYRFSDVKSTRNTQKYIKVGCSLMHTLLQSQQGIEYLANNKVLRQIAECLAQCDPTSGITAGIPLFSKDRMTDTLSGGYFAMLGVLSADKRGLEMLQRWRMFNMMYHILEYNQRPDLSKLLLSSFDYSFLGHPRVLLRTTMTASTKEIRIYATNILRKFVSNPKEGNANHSRWAIQLLVEQLYDPEVEVSATAIKILERACNTKSYLEFIVGCRPALDHLGEIGAPLLLRFLSTSIGYDYLDGLDYIRNEMDDWFLGRNDSYVNTVEASLARAFADVQDEPTNRLSLLDDEPDPEADPHVPPHFYRELTRTEEGCKLLEQKGHFLEFANTIREYGMQADDAEIMTKVKGCMWAVGNVGSMDRGAPFLESCDVIEHIVRIAEQHEVMSMRGTAFFVVGLISRSVHGLEILSELGWDANTNSIGMSTGFCVPSNISKFLSLRPWKHQIAGSIVLPHSQRTESVKAPVIHSRPRSDSMMEAMGAPNSLYDNINTGAFDDDEDVVLDPDPINHKILSLFIDLSNTVRFSKARNDLVALKEKKPQGFANAQVFRRVVALMETHHYRLPARRMLELFERSVLREVVFGDDSDNEDTNDDESLGPSYANARLRQGLQSSQGDNGDGEGEYGGSNSGSCGQRVDRRMSSGNPMEMEPRERRGTV